MSCDVDPRVAAAHVGDALRIRQILSNFLSNAVKFTATGGIALRVRVLDDGEAQRLEFSVTDTGVGIEVGKQHELFQDFAQADASTASRSGGTGLGLVICRRLATLMDGDVRMESAPGEGTVLCLSASLPVADPRDVEAGVGAPLGGRPALRRRPKPSRHEAEQEGSVLLLAEDHPISRRVLVHQLGIIGFHVDTADDGRAALERFTTHRYGLVLTDLNMPVMDGFDLARAIRRHEAAAGWSRTPVLALSANVVQEEAEKCANAGMDDFVGKPAPMPVLAERLHRWMPHLQWPDASEPPDVRDAAVDAAGGSDDRVIDLTVLHDLTGGDDDVAATILDDFVASSGSDIAELRAAVARCCEDDVRRSAHRIKGASRMVGALEVATLATDLEGYASTSAPDWRLMNETADSLRIAVDRVASSIAASSGR
jgi:CheY-like chemotaxis protein/HPt (histidine-containing phosphotransfer) domain-containing protein/anti-sigma regulatory factor (Ser/Thr protein kinase)